MKYPALLSILILASHLSAQVIGGRSNSEISPKVAEPSKLSGGGFVGDVNAFNGQFNASMPLGSVSTPSGLSFQLNLSYNNSFSLGYTKPMCSGIPYGEGWSPDIPTISVETDAFHKFVSVSSSSEPGLRECYEDQNNFLHDGLDYRSAPGEYNATDEGDVYWFSPTVNIPGVGSGRAIFKYVDVQDDQCAVFVLNKFEKAMEIRFYGDKWLIITDDGKRYEFGTHVSNYRAPSNRRIAYYNSDPNITATSSPAEHILKEGEYRPANYEGVNPDGIKNVIEPKKSYNMWYCNSIMDILSPGNTIWFVYEKYGEFNYFKEFAQDRYGYLNQNTYATATTFLYAPDYSAYTDVLLTDVVASVIDGKYESLEMVYETVDNLISPQMIDFNDPSAGRLDSLYSYQVVADYGMGADNFTSWKKYRHAKHDGLGGGFTPQAYNPYLDEYEFYHRANHNQEPGFTENNDELAFSHSFLESERILGSSMYPGDIYEIKSIIQRDNNTDLQRGNGTIDIAIVSGNNDEVYPYGYSALDNGSSIINKAVYEKTRGIEIFSTFNMAMKWQMGSDEGTVETSNFFVMPNLRTSADGLHIQIGPGNSDQNYAYTAENIMANNSSFDVYDTYWYNNPTMGKSAARIGHNFGVGYPWNMMAPAYKEMQSPSTGIYGVALNNVDLYKTWWTSTNIQNLYNIPNIPTKFGNETKLKQVQLIRYSKNAYMLTGVRHHRYNGETLSIESPNVTSPGDKIVSQKKMEYSYKDVALVDRYPVDSLPTAPKGINRRIILLSSIKEVPMDGNLDSADFDLPTNANYSIADTSRILTTYFEYSEFNGSNVNMGSQKLTPNDRVYLLTGYTDHLGGLTRVEYYPFDNAHTRFNEDYHKPGTCEGIYTSEQGSEFLSGSITVYPIVHFLYKNDISDELLNGTGTGLKKWEYLYDLADGANNPSTINLKLDHFSNGHSMRVNKGFTSVRIVNPPTENGGAITYTDYEFWGAIPSGGLTNLTLEDYLYFGKPKSIKTYAQNGTLHEEKLFNYANTLAFINGYERPNFYREQLRYDLLLYGSYEYKDIYLNDQIEAYLGGDTIVYGDRAKRAKASRHFIGNTTVDEGPKFLEFYFFDSLLTAAGNRDYFFRSYFVKTQSEITRTYDNGLAKNVVISPYPPAVANLRTSNPGGDLVVNPVGNDPETDGELITIATNLEEGWEQALIAASPLSDSVLFAMHFDTTSYPEKVINVLAAQQGLSDTVWGEVINAFKVFNPQQLLNLVNLQPYFSDSVQIALIDYAQKNALTLKGTNDVVFEAAMNKNAYLTDAVTQYMCDHAIPGECFTNIIATQPQYSDILLKRIITSENLQDKDLVIALKDQYLSDDMFMEIIRQSKYSETAITELIEEGTPYPSDAVLMFLLNERQDKMKLDLGLRIFGKTDHDLDKTVLNLIDAVFNVNDAKEIHHLLNNFKSNPLAKYCGSPLVQNRLYIETKKSYEYYEADYTGKTIGSAYEVLMGRKKTAKDASPYPFTIPNEGYGVIHPGAIVDGLRIKHEPSWQVYAVETTSPHLPNAYNREEYYYLYDLQNRYDRYWYNYDLNEERIQIKLIHILNSYQEIFDTIGVHLNWDSYYTSSSPALPQFDGMNRTRDAGNRVLAFQKASISKNTRDTQPIIRSEYYHYDRRWLFDDIPAPPVDTTFIGDTCATIVFDPSTSCATSIADCDECRVLFHKPYMDQSDIVAMTPYYYCSWWIPDYGYYTCPLGGMDWTTVYPTAQLLYCNEGTAPNPSGRVPMGTLLADLLKLKEVTIQVDTVGLGKNSEFDDLSMDDANTYIAEFYMGSPYDYDADGFPAPHYMVLPFDHLKVRTIKERNRYLQPKLEENQTGLQTRYYYNATQIYHFQNTECNSDSYVSKITNDIALPVRVCVGYNRADSLSTAYEYNDIGQISKVTEPSGKYTEYDFDTYGRLRKVTENGSRVLSEVMAYNTWNHQSQSFAARLSENYVQTHVYNSDNTIDPDDYEVRKAFVDPLGIEHSTISAYKLDDGTWRQIHTGTADKDNWDRANFVHKNHLVNSVSATISPSYVLPGTDPNPYSSALYEDNPKSRPLRVADIGVNINDNEVVTYQYHITNNIFTSCELALNLDELSKIMGPASTSAFRFFRKEVTDQDGKKAIEYTNAIGQKIATLTYTNGTEKVVTLFVYDSYGNLSEVINPTRQSSKYWYNLMGQLYKEQTVDAGIKKYMYNKQGLVSIVQDQQLALLRDDQDNLDPQYRVYQYDAYGKVLAEGRMLVKNFPYTYSEVYDPLYYSTTFKGTSVGIPFYQTFDTSDLYFDYTFTNRSTQDWLTKFDVWADQGGGTYHVSHFKDVYTYITMDYTEKSYVYGNNPTLSTIGKIITSTSYDNAGVAVQSIDFDYDANENLAEQHIEFNPNGIGSTGSKNSRIYYPAYNYRGSLLQEKVDVDNDAAIDYHCYMVYDRLNRLKEVYATPYETDNISQSIKLVSYTYDDATGALVEKKHHMDKDGADAIITEIEYSYDLRSRLTRIQAGQMSDGLNPIMDYQLLYDGQNPSVFHDNNYNGNINGSIMSYNFDSLNVYNSSIVSGFNSPTTYGYTYDKMNRLIKADATVTAFIAGGDGTGYGIGDIEVYYDKIGNIKSLIRNIKGNGNPFDTDFMEEEHFNYTYAAGTNKLLSVVGQNAYTQSRSYTYDPNGNVLTDDYRNINATEYGRAAYPFALTDNVNNTQTNFLYSANDQRVYKSVVESGDTTTDYYLIDAMGKTIAIWHKDSLQTWEYYVSGREREVRITPAASPDFINQCTFFLYDHLGNTRITYKVYKLDPTNGTPTPDDYLALYEIKSVHDYFPYGKELRYFNQERYLTTQHERDQNTGLDYRGARYYDGDIGRFLSLDPLAKDFVAWSPYNYVVGNPAKLVDPTGKGPEDWVKTEKGEYVWDNTVNNQFQVHEGQTYVGKENSDIVKDLVGQETYTAKTWDAGTIGSESGRAYVATSHAKAFTKLNVRLEANVSYDGDNRTFNGLNVYASGVCKTYAPTNVFQAIDFSTTSLKLNGKEMSEDAYQPPTIGDQQIPYKTADIAGHTGSMSAQQVYSARDASKNISVSLSGQITFGGVPLTGETVFGQMAPNSTSLSLTIPFKQ